MPYIFYESSVGMDIGDTFSFETEQEAIAAADAEYKNMTHADKLNCDVFKVCKVNDDGLLVEEVVDWCKPFICAAYRFRCPEPLFGNDPQLFMCLVVYDRAGSYLNGWYFNGSDNDLEDMMREIAKRKVCVYNLRLPAMTQKEWEDLVCEYIRFHKYFPKEIPMFAVFDSMTMTKPSHPTHESFEAYLVSKNLYDREHPNRFEFVDLGRRETVRDMESMKATFSHDEFHIAPGVRGQLSEDCMVWYLWKSFPDQARAFFKAVPRVGLSQTDIAAILRVQPWTCI